MVTMQQLVQPQTELPVKTSYSRSRLALGIVGRTWLWFVAGCLVITLVPLLFGWRPFVIESGSMQPRIKAGDIVLASPNHNAQQLLGHVTVFQDPDLPKRVKTHRVIRVTDDGRLVTKGDANQSPDSQAVQVTKVRGLGRLLVRYAGLPLLWAHRGQWLYVVMFGLSLWLAAVAVARDQETEEEEPDDGAPAEADAGSGAGGVGERHAGLDRALVARACRRLAWRSAGLLGLCLILALPTTRAAFAAQSNNSSDSWAVPNWNYTTEAKALTPFIYYKLDEASGTSATDSSTNGYTGTLNGGAANYAYGVNGAFVTDSPDTGVTQLNNNACIYTPAGASRPTPGPATYSEVVWFKAASGYSSGGKLVGLETARTGLSDSNNGGQYDRHVYMDGNGRLWFGVWLTASGTPKTISTATQYDDGAWHMMVATMGAAGMKLYVDGVLQASDANTTSETFLNPGYWRFGCGNLSGWGGATTWSGPNAPAAQANVAFQGSLDEVAIYNTQLTAANVAFLYWIR